MQTLGVPFHLLCELFEVPKAAHSTPVATGPVNANVDSRYLSHYAEVKIVINGEPESTLHLLVGDVDVVLGLPIFGGPPTQTLILRVLAHALLKQVVQCRDTGELGEATLSGYISVVKILDQLSLGKFAALPTLWKRK